jgi:hypothetical protein
MVQQTGRYSNPQEQIESLKEALFEPDDRHKRHQLLKILPVILNRSEPTRPRLRLSQGAIADAVLAVLSQAAGPLYTRQICQLAEQKLKHSVSYDTVCSFLTVSAKQHHTSGIYRVGRGRYILIRPGRSRQ